MKNHSRKPGFCWILCLILSSASGCTLVKDDYGSCTPAVTTTEIRPIAAAAAAINGPNAVVCISPAQMTSDRFEGEVGLATTSAGPAPLALIPGEAGPFRTSACVDMDFCALAAHGPVRLDLETVWGPGICAAEYEIPPCSCADTQPACECTGATDYDKAYVFISDNGRDYIHVETAAHRQPRECWEPISLSIDTGRPYRFVRPGEQRAADGTHRVSNVQLTTGRETMRR